MEVADGLQLESTLNSSSGKAIVGVLYVSFMAKCCLGPPLYLFEGDIAVE